MTEPYYDLLQGLNEPQRQAVTTIEGSLLILAGPGSGKTRVITHRIAYLIRARHVRPWHILAVTFTNKAAREMRERLTALAGEESRDVMMGTFHATCARILRQEADHVGLDKRFTIFDDDDQLTIIKQALKDLNLDEKQHAPRAMLGRISDAKNKLITVPQFAEQVRTYRDEIVARVYRRYQDLLREHNGVDFDDLIMLVCQLWRQNPDILAHYQHKYRYIHVDEFQDTNEAQYRLIRYLGLGIEAAPGLRNVCVVADDDQGIYSWRGADVRNIFQFEADFAPQVILLEQNYRSTQIILDAAHAVVRRNTERKDKKLWTQRAGGPLITLYEAYNEDEEGQFVASKIAALVRRGEYRYQDCAVMYRTNAQSRALEEQMLRAGIPYVVIGSKKFYERKEIKDMLAYLRLLANPADVLSLRRIINVPSRKIGPKTVDELLRWATEQHLTPLEAAQRVDEHPTLAASGKNAVAQFGAIMTDLQEAATTLKLHELIDRILDRTGYAADLRDGTPEGEERWENVLELRRLATDYSEIQPLIALDLFLEQIALVGGSETTQTSANDQGRLVEEPRDAVTLITLHAAKGLEFPVVFIVGMDEGLLPHSRSLSDHDQMAEERRLAYVGITRAKDRLFFVHAFRRAFYGSFDSTLMEPSRFLSDIPPDLIEEDNWSRGHLLRLEASDDSESSRGRRKKTSPMGAWTAGLSPSFGNGSSGNGRSRSRRSGLPASSSHSVSNEEDDKAAYRPGETGQEDDRQGHSERPVAPRFKGGEKVRHRIFGEGVVLRSQLTSDSEIVEVLFPGKIGKKTLDLEFARLEKI